MEGKKVKMCFSQWLSLTEKLGGREAEQRSFLLIPSKREEG